jgi:hypothetical protein
MSSSVAHELDVRRPRESTSEQASPMNPCPGTRILASISARSGRGAVWQRTWLGAKGSEVRILSPRPFLSARPAARTLATMTDSARNAIIAIAVATPFALGLWVYGRWRAGDLQLRREILVIVGTIGGMLILAAAFAGPPPATLLVPPMWVARRRHLVVDVQAARSILPAWCRAVYRARVTRAHFGCAEAGARVSGSRH